MAYETTGPPRFAGVLGVIGVPLVYTAGLVEYVSAEGGTAFTVIVSEAVVKPPELVAVTV